MDTKRRTFMKWCAAAPIAATLVRYLQVDGFLKLDDGTELDEGNYEMVVTYDKCTGEVLEREIKKVG